MTVLCAGNTFNKAYCGIINVCTYIYMLSNSGSARTKSNKFGSTHLEFDPSQIEDIVVVSYLAYSV